MVLQVRGLKIVVGKRADVEDDDVKGRVARRNSRRELHHALLFIVKERLVPVLHFLACGDGVACLHAVGLGQNLGLRLGTFGLRQNVRRAHGRRRLHEERLHDQKSHVERRDRGDAHKVAQEVIAQHDHHAPADHLRIDEVPDELHDVVHREAGDARGVGDDALRPRQPALRPDERNA